MEEHVPTRIENPQLDEEIWQAWVRKNEVKDRVRLARRKKLLAIVLTLGIVAVVLWRIVRLL
jgi:membrane protein required for beta-lactamase induction